MKKLLTLVALLLVAGVAIGAAFLLRRQGPEWTTGSPQALRELRAGNQASLQLYFNDAIDHYQKALAADPDFAMAKMNLLLALRRGGGDPERIGSLLDELQAVDLESLNPRERLLIGYYRQMIARKPDAAHALLADYLADHPDDPFALELECGRLWGSGDAREAEACYRRLIELDPNWVEAQNRIGYLAMARGDFADAEEQFEIYRYIAPDQANPHDSLGELYSLRGRYDEAEREFRAAIAAKADFCPSWQNLVQVAMLRADYDEADRRLAEAVSSGGCEPAALRSLTCRLALWRLADAGRWSESLAQARECGQQGEIGVFQVWAGLSASDPEAVTEVEKRIASYAAEMHEKDPVLGAMEEHIAGARSLTAGDAAAAAEHFRSADATLEFRSEQWLFKLFNRQALVTALERAGRADEAGAVEAELARVNPEFASRPPFLLPGAAAAR